MQPSSWVYENEIKWADAGRWGDSAGRPPINMSLNGFYVPQNGLPCRVLKEAFTSRNISPPNPRSKQNDSVQMLSFTCSTSFD